MLHIWLVSGLLQPDGNPPAQLTYPLNLGTRGLQAGLLGWGGVKANVRSVIVPAGSYGVAAA